MHALMMVLACFTASDLQFETYKAESAILIAEVSASGDDSVPGDVCGTCRGTGKWMLDGQAQGDCPACGGTGKTATRDKPELFEPPIVDVVPEPEVPEKEPPVIEVDADVMPIEMQGPREFSFGDYYVIKLTAPYCNDPGKPCYRWDLNERGKLVAAGVTVTDIDITEQPDVVEQFKVLSVPFFLLCTKVDKHAHMPYITTYSTSQTLLDAIRVLDGKLQSAALQPVTKPVLSRVPYVSRNPRVRWSHKGVFYDDVARRGNARQIEAGRQILISYMRGNHVDATAYDLDAMTLLELFYLHGDLN